MSAIMIVDDDPHIRELVRVFLQKEGSEINSSLALTLLSSQ